MFCLCIYLLLREKLKVGDFVFNMDFGEWVGRTRQWNLEIIAGSLGDYSKHPGLGVFATIVSAIAEGCVRIFPLGRQFVGPGIFTLTHFVIVGFAASLFLTVLVRRTKIARNSIARLLFYLSFLLAGSWTIVSIPESFGLAAASLMWAFSWYLVLSNRPFKRFLCVTAVTGGCTLTNGMYPFLCEIRRRLRFRTKGTNNRQVLSSDIKLRRTFVQSGCTLRTLALVLLIAAIAAGTFSGMIERFVRKHLGYANYRVFRNPSRAALYAVWGTVAPVILPRLSSEKSRLSFEPVRSLDYDLLQWPGIAAWWMATGIGIILASASERRAWAVPALIWMVWNLGFHNFWGDEFFMYSAHWSWSLFVLFAIGLSTLKTTWQVTVLALVITAQLAGWMNFINSAREIAHQPPYQVFRHPFYIFGVGMREKYLYRAGTLLEVATGRVVQKWELESEQFFPEEYKVQIKLRDGNDITIFEDESGVWLSAGSARTMLAGTNAPVRLPRFDDLPYAKTLRILHHEVLIGVTRQGPVPNPLVYAKPWYRDAAMMAKVLKETGNLDHIRDWILSLREPYDMNNGVAEPDNLGQALYLISLVSDKNHPLVPRILEEAERIAVRKNGIKYLDGITDGAHHPVYQTKWLKYGLKALGLPDDWTIPPIADSYSALFWMDYKDQYIPTRDSGDRTNYPYLAWACAHFHGARPGPLAENSCFLTWEANSSQANYRGMAIINDEFVRARVAMPHTWHAAEAFLYLIELTDEKR